MKSFLEKFKSPKFLLKLALVALVYYFSAKFGLSLAYSYKQVSLVWPPTGISLAILLLFGLDLWPGIAIGAFFINLATLEPVRTALGVAGGNTLEALIGAFLLTKFAFNKSFERVRDVIIFVVFAAIFSTMISATIGTASLIWGGIGSWQMYFPVFLNWWVGDLLGNMVVAPAILVWSKVTKFKFNFYQIVEGVLLTSFIFLVGLALFTGTIPGMTFELQSQFKYIMFPLVLWASYRFRQKGSTLTVLIVTGVAVWGAVTGAGPFAIGMDPEKSLLFMASFSGLMALTFLFFSVIIEERDKAEERVKASEKGFRSLIENSSDAIILVDPTAKITYTSQSVKRVIGYEPEELVGTNGFNIIYQDDINNSRKALETILKNPGKTVRIQNRLIKKDGAVHWMEAEGKNMLEDPFVSAVVINFRDINDRMQMDKVKSEFLSLSAHQLRSPLSIIRWYTESLLSEKSFPKELITYLTELYKAALNMNETVNLLLDVSRFELGTMKVETTEVDMKALVKEVLASKKQLIITKGLLVASEGEGEIPEILGDPKLIKIIIENLLSNAIKYSPAGGKITMSIKEGPDNILFKIADTGIGIPIEDQQKIFTKLYRGSNVKKVEPSGLGLGLYLIRLIVDFNGGNIWFESEEGKGTTFFVEFPKKVNVRK